MSTSKKQPLRNLSIYLIKEGLDEPSSFIDSDKYSCIEEIHHGGSLLGYLYIKTPTSNPPKWASMFKNYIDTGKLGEVSTSSALLLIQTHGRFYGITFGQGRYLLKSDSWEERFGLKVALNSIGDQKIKSIDKRTFDTISKHSREQASLEVEARDFGLDVEQDLLRAITGTPKNMLLGHRMSGMDALKVNVRTEVHELPELLKIYYEKFLDDSYKASYPWVDNLSEVKSSDLSMQLDSIVIQLIIGRQFDKCWLAVPELIEWENVDGFCYGFSNKSPIYNDIHLSDFILNLKNNVNICIDLLHRKRVYCVGENDKKLYDWSIYKCIYCEIEHNDDAYLLSGGKWYRVNRNFVEEVDKAFEKINRLHSKLPEYKHESEGAYNSSIAEEEPEVYAKMDKENIHHGGGYSKIEFCDLYTNSRKIIHVKRYGASSVLSHLFSQGVISGELFQVDREFRSKVNRKLPDTHKLKDVDAHPRRGEYTVVFAIVSDSDGDELTLPFFSRLNVKHAARRLEGYGYQVMLAKIKVNDIFRKTKRYR